MAHEPTTEEIRDRLANLKERKALGDFAAVLSEHLSRRTIYRQTEDEPPTLEGFTRSVIVGELERLHLLDAPTWRDYLAAIEELGKRAGSASQPPSGEQVAEDAKEALRRAANPDDVEKNGGA